MVVVSVPPCGGIRLRGGLVSVRDGLVAGFCDLWMSQGGKRPKPLSGVGRDPTRRRVGKGWTGAWDVCVQGGVRGLEQESGASTSSLPFLLLQRRWKWTGWGAGSATGVCKVGAYNMRTNGLWGGGRMMGGGSLTYGWGDRVFVSCVAWGGRRRRERQAGGR